LYVIPNKNKDDFHAKYDTPSVFSTFGNYFVVSVT